MSDDKPQQSLPEIDRGRHSRFIRGGKAGPGRPPKTLNKVTHTVKSAMEAAIAKVGSDGSGRGGVAGYLEAVARSNPELMTAAYLRATVPPAPPAVPDEAAVGQISEFVIVSVAPGDCVELDENGQVHVDSDSEAEALWRRRHGLAPREPPQLAAPVSDTTDVVEAATAEPPVNIVALRPHSRREEGQT